LMGQKVDYFIGSKAVDTLIESKWGTGKSGAEVLFPNRDAAILYLDKLLGLGFFSHVNRIKKKKKSDEKDKESKEKDGKEKETEKEKEDTDSKKPKKKKEKDEGEGSEGKKKVKVKVKLEMCDNIEQFFVDGDEAFVWIFDPVHPRTFVMGVLVVIATIAICMFPLWPESVQGYVWYVSVAGAFAVGMILFLALFRYILFGMIWVCTMGKHHFWLLPNLTEDCGFFESFVPLYMYKFHSNDDEAAKQKKDDDYRPDSAEPEDAQREEEEEENEEQAGNDSETLEKEPWVEVTPEDAETARQEAENAEKEPPEADDEEAN